MQGTGKVRLCASVGEGRGDVKPAKTLIGLPSAVEIR